MEFVGEELLTFHFIFSFLLIFPPFINLFYLIAPTSHTKKLKILAFVAPAYYTILAASLLSGLVIWAMLGFGRLAWAWLMLGVWLYVLVFEIIRHKKQKQIKIEPDKQIREAFFGWAKRKNGLDLILFCLLFLSIL